MKECTNAAVDLWPLFWATFVISACAYYGLQVWVQYKLRMAGKALLEIE